MSDLNKRLLFAMLEAICIGVGISALLGVVYMIIVQGPGSIPLWISIPAVILAWLPWLIEKARNRKNKV